MAQPTSILNADRGRATTAALVFLCALATAQMVLFALALVHEGAPDPSSGGKSPEMEAPVTPEPPRAVKAPVRAAPPEPGTLASPAPTPQFVKSFGPPPIGSFEMQPGQIPAPSAIPVPRAEMPERPALPAARPVASAGAPPPHPSLKHLPPLAGAAPVEKVDAASNMSLEELLRLAKQVRSLGDMQGALEVLRKADLRFPAHPEVTAEMAQSYEQMGLAEKAAALWRQLGGMDQAQAGGWRDLAKRRLNAPASPEGFGQGLGNSTQTLSLGACRIRRDTSFLNGEKVVLNIPVLRRGNVPVDPSQVDINVYFFDRVNGREISQTIADDPPSTWTAPPVDWAGIGEEPLEVTYLMPNLTPGEVAAHGKRAYHGFVVRLYYQNKLQDVAADPRDLLDYGSPAPRSDMGGVNPLLPPATQ